MRDTIFGIFDSIPDQYLFAKNDPGFRDAITRFMVKGENGVTEQETHMIKELQKNGVLPGDLQMKAWENAFPTGDHSVSVEQMRQQAFSTAEKLFDDIIADAPKNKPKKKKSTGIRGAVEEGVDHTEKFLEMLGFEEGSLYRRPEDVINWNLPGDRKKFSEASIGEKFRLLAGTLGGYGDAIIKTAIEMPWKGMHDLLYGAEPEDSAEETGGQKTYRRVQNAMAVVQPVNDWITLMQGPVEQKLGIQSEAGAERFNQALTRFYENPLLYYAILKGGIKTAEKLASRQPVPEIQPAKKKAAAGEVAAEGAEGQPPKVKPAATKKAAKPETSLTEKLIDEKIETGNKPADAARNLGHAKRNLEVAEQAARDLTDEAQVARSKSDIAKYKAEVFKYEQEYNQVVADMNKASAKTTIPKNRTELMAFVTANERNAYPVDKAIVNARKKYLNQETLQGAGDAELRAYAERIKARVEEGGRDLYSYEKPVRDAVMESSVAAVESARASLSETIATLGEAADFSKLFTMNNTPLKHFKQAKNRFKSGPGVEFVDKFGRMDTRAHNLWGYYLERAKAEGIGETRWYQSSWGKEGVKLTGEDIANLMEKKKSPGLKKLMDDIHTDAKAAGMEIGYVGEGELGYFPRVIKQEMIELLFEDSKRALKELKSNPTMADMSVAKAFEGYSKNFQDAVKHLLETEQATSLKEAVKMLDREAVSSVFPDVRYTKTRTLDLPSEFYNRNAHEVIPNYIAAMTKAIAQSEMWGKGGKGFYKLLDDMNAWDVAEAKFATDIMKVWTGVLDQTAGFKGAARKWANAYMGFEFVTKIGLGRATILNVLQPVISYGPSLGVWRSFKGHMTLFQPGTRALIRQSGVLTRPMMEAMTGYMPKGFWGKASRFMGNFSLFKPVNVALQYLSASALRYAVRDFHRIANANPLTKHGKARQAWARNRLGELHLDWKKPLTEDAVQGAMYRFTMDSQLQYNLMREPYMLNHPKGKPFFVFKRFGGRQAAWIKDMVYTEIKRGNVMPIIRLAIGGYLGGELVHWGLNKIYSALRGEPVYRKDDSMWERAIENYSVIGAMGMITDVMNIEKLSDVYSQAKFLAMPVGWSDGEAIAETMIKFHKDYERYGDFWLATKRNAHGLFGVAGSYPRQWSNRLKTQYQKLNTLADRKKREKEKVFELILGGKADAAAKRVTDWNREYEEAIENYGPIPEDDKYLLASKVIMTVDDISYMALETHMINQLKNYLKAAGKSTDDDEFYTKVDSLRAIVDEVESDVVMRERYIGEWDVDAAVIEVMKNRYEDKSKGE
jgi:hypothetical protein